MKEHNFKQELKREFLKRELSDAQFKTLNQYSKKTFTWPRFKILVPGFGIAALCCFLVWSFFIQQTQFEKIATEVAYNHNKQMPSEIQTADYLKINHFLDRLDFELVESPKLAALNIELVGGRYCSIAGEIAAQLKYKDKTTGEILTIYQFKATKLKIFSKDFVEEQDGIVVRLWREGNIGIAVARTRL